MKRNKGKQEKFLKEKIQGDLINFNIKDGEMNQIEKVVQEEKKARNYYLDSNKFS